ncbi:hypothetical protein [Brevundimonas sp.]|uniref:hypothetical protein n=1 Tax=Brevundimonas sp. TaxID=1871086 RepID=UPI002D64D26A|nr:hypothetical protein [Brevundimonas sp.]HYC96331.1 hypothetical protein [Brevundimonas sp.]
MKPFPYDALKKRFDDAMLVLCISVGIPLGIVVGADWLRRRLNFTDEAAILSWPVTNVPLAPWAAAGCVLGAVLAIVICVRGSRPWWPVVRWPWLFLALAAAAAVALSLGSHVRIYPDRIVASGVDGAPGEEVLRFETATQIEVGCALINYRRRSDIATLSYAVYFPRGEVVHLQDARSGGQAGARRWFEAVNKLDEQSLASIPHGPRAPAHSISCVRALRAELGEPAFSSARRMLGISGRDLSRYYAEPHEAFKRKSDDGL